MTILDLLASSGFRIRGNRADCPFCPGTRRLTVAIDARKGVAYCHRCQWATNVWSLARQQGVTLPPQRIARARIRKQQFAKWLSKTCSEMSRREQTMAHRAAIATEAAPDWDALAEWYHNERRFETFWSNVRDRIGRRALYVAWRRANA